MKEEETISKEEYVEEEKRRREKEEEKKQKELKPVDVEKKEREVKAAPSEKEERLSAIPILSLDVISEFKPSEVEVDKEIPKIEKEERKVFVPIIKLQEPSPQFKEYELDYEVLRIEKKSSALNVPIIRVKSSPKIIASITEFDRTIEKPKQPLLPKITVPIYRKSTPISPKAVIERFDSTITKQPRELLESKAIHVPIIRAKSAPKITISITEFDSSIEKPKQPLLPKIMVPIYRKFTIISPKLAMEHFDSTITEQLRERLEGIKEKEKETILHVEKSKPEQVEVPAPSLSKGRKEGFPGSFGFAFGEGGGTIGEEGSKGVIKAEQVEVPPPASKGRKEEFPDFFEFVLGESGGKIGEKGPKVILFKDIYGDSHINFLEELCLRIYREKKGGEPSAKTISTYDEFWKMVVEKWLDPSDKIITIDLDYEENGKYPWKEEVNDSELRARLNELYTEEIGFIIFKTAEEEMFKEYERKLESINKAINYRINIIKIKLEEPFLPKSFANFIWGNALEGDLIGKFDEIFNKAKKAFNGTLKKIGEEEGGLFKSVTKRSERRTEGDGQESDLHYDIKVFLVSFLTNKLREKGELPSASEDIAKKIEEIKKKIKTEEPFRNTDITPDVRMDDLEAYEVETLFGEGEHADKKIDETINKYDKVTSIRKVYVVMDNLGFLIHLKDLLMKMEHFKNKRFGVEFCTLDLRNKKLISLADFVEELKRFMEEVKRSRSLER